MSTLEGLTSVISEFGKLWLQLAGYSFTLISTKEVFSISDVKYTIM